MENVKLFNDSFQNYKVYGIPKAQLIIADVPYNLSNNAYASNPAWYIVAGSGSTLFAAASLGRKAYGFEVNKQFYNDANKKMLSRIQLVLFQ